MAEPAAPPPDDRDWTYVLRDGCDQCGFQPFDAQQAAARLRATVPRWRRALSSESARIRPEPLVWSPLEYGCHVRDVCGIMARRAELMLATDGARFDNWDQDATALTDRYWEQDPGIVADEIADAVARAVETFERVPNDAWDRRGVRSNGSQFTVATLAVYFLHDVEHHLHDVEA